MDATSTELLQALKFLTLRAGKISEKRFRSRFDYECFFEAYSAACEAIEKVEGVHPLLGIPTK